MAHNPSGPSRRSRSRSPGARDRPCRDCQGLPETTIGAPPSEVSLKEDASPWSLVWAAGCLASRHLCEKTGGVMHLHTRRPETGRQLPPDHRVPHHPASPRLPVPDLPQRDYIRPAHYTVAVVDGHGRVAVTTPLRVLGWTPGAVVAFTVETNRLITATCINSPAPPPGTAPRRKITPRGHLNLPVITRRRAGITRDDRLLLVADTDTGTLWMIPPNALALILQPHTTGHRRQL